MRVLLLGGTGNLGLRCIQALLAHGHILTLYVRNVEKLRSLVSPALIEKVESVVVGDATDATGIKKALLEHDIEAIVDVAGNQVLPWKEFLLPKIAKAVSEAAIAVRKERGKPLRAWVTSGMGVLEYPGTPHLIQSFMPKAGGAQHQATRDVIEPILITDLRWSLICVAMMKPANPKQGKFEPLSAPHSHNLLVQANSLPGWTSSWIEKIPLIGMYLWVWFYEIWEYTTPYEAVADFLAEDLENQSEEWIGKKIGYIEKKKVKEV